MTEIFRGSETDSTAIINLLESQQIRVFVTNGLMSSIEPWAACPKIIKVDDGDAEKAHEIISDYEAGNFSL